LLTPSIATIASLMWASRFRDAGASSGRRDPAHERANRRDVEVRHRPAQVADDTAGQRLEDRADAAGAVDVLDAKRKAINGALKERGMKVSFTHLIAWAIVQAARDMPVMGHAYAEQDGKPQRVTPATVSLGLAEDDETAVVAREVLPRLLGLLNFPHRSGSQPARIKRPMLSRGFDSPRHDGGRGASFIFLVPSSA
jgi:hypothetical protein